MMKFRPASVDRPDGVAQNIEPTATQFNLAIAHSFR
jgi:hypothetical protein